jgi:hypothetical protein
MIDAPVFVVGTGRCGSTLVSALLREHPAVTSLSEVFSFATDLGTEIDRAFPEGQISGAALWRILATPWPWQSLMLRHDVAMEEVLYPWRGGGRWGARSGVPAICQAALPHLSGDPDGLFDALAAAAVALDPAPVGVQYARLFEWLRARAGARLWVERSGGSLRIVSRLRRAFPAARFVHIVRDGRDTALSMSRHAGFRMVFAAFQLIEGLGVDPMASTDRRWEGDLSDELAALLPERFTREAFARFDTPPPLCAHYWSGEISQGLAELAGLGEERLLTIRYEDLLGLREGATECAAGLISFILGEVDPAWLRRCVALVGQGRSRWQELPPRLRAQTEDACAPGFAALAAAGLTWP